ncbi:MAG: hypothetical protein K2N48_07125, partial [Muribaculaceae bacterium]|nr:hypothetical protein [Muribaculaceae bacterium]
MKDIKTLYLDAKARGTPSAISAYTEAVHTLLESNPQEYYSELGYIIKSSIGLSTFQTFVEKWGLPIPAYGTVMAMMEECKNDCEKQDKDASKYEEAIQYLEGFRAKHPHCFAIYEMCMDNSEAARDTLGPDAKLPLKMESNEEYIQRYYSINEKSGIQGRKTLPKRGDMSMARIPDVIITAASMNESAMNTVCEYFQGMYDLNLPARYTNQTLCECAKDFPDVKCSAITGILEQGLDIDHMIQSAQARNYQIFRESALMQNESAKQYLTEDEVIAVQNMISILEYTVLEQSGQAATDTQNRIYSLYEMLDGYIDDQGNVIAESVETLEENPLITEAEEIAQYFQTLSIIDESVEPFMEVSRGKLQGDYRAGVDIKTGHPVQIIYSLDNIKLTDVGYYRDPDSGDYPMHHQDLIDTAQKNIRKRGNLDHQSKGQKVLAIKDLYEVQKQKGSKKKDKSKIYLDEVECIGIFNIKGVSQKALKDPKKMQEEIASSKGRIKTFKVKVGQVDNDPSYKSTYWPKSSASKTQSSVSREVAYREHFKYGRGSEIKKVADIIDLFHDYTSIMEIGRGLWGIKLMHADSDYTDTPADQQVTVAVFLSTGVRHMSDHHDFRKMPAAQQNARYQTCLTAISKILTSLNHKHHLTKGGWGTKDDAKYGYIGSYFHELAEKGDAKAAKELERKVRHELEKVQHDKKHLPESIYKKLLGQMRELDMMIHRAYNLYFKDAIAKKDAKELKKPKLESYEFDEFEPDYSPMTESEAIVTGAAYLGALMREDVADAILPMLPSAGAATEAAPWMMNTMNKKLGTTPTYLARNHNMGYGEDDKSSGSDDDDDDSSHDHSLDDFARKPSSDDEGDTSGDGDDSVKATEPESPVVTPQSTAAANYYYYTYNNSLNQNKNSFNKDSSTHDDHSRHSKT